MIRASFGRRRVLQLLGGGALAGKAAAEQAAKQLANIGAGGSGLPGMDLRNAIREPDRDGPCAMSAPTQPGTDWRILREMRDRIIRTALDTKESRAELEELLYEENRRVCQLDPDLAYNRSWSLAAKLCYQRQRNVQSAIEYSIMDRSPWQRACDWRDKILSIAGIKI